MNRKQRRKIMSQIGFRQTVKEMQIVQKALGDHKFFKNGCSVKLNVEEIKSHPDWSRKTEAYKNFVELHKNNIFTVQYDEKHGDKPLLVCLKEDTTTPKWLWSEQDLIRCKSSS